MMDYYLRFRMWNYKTDNKNEMQLSIDKGKTIMQIHFIFHFSEVWIF